MLGQDRGESHHRRDQLQHRSGCFRRAQSGPDTWRSSLGSLELGQRSRSLISLPLSATRIDICLRLGMFGTNDNGAVSLTNGDPRTKLQLFLFQRAHLRYRRRHSNIRRFEFSGQQRQHPRRAPATTGLSSSTTTTNPYFSLYVHIRQYSAFVEVGDKVSAGDPLARVGNAGSTGGAPHLHLSVYRHRQNGSHQGSPDSLRGA